MRVQVIDNQDISKLKERFLDGWGDIAVYPATCWHAFGWEKVRYFMHIYPIYVLPTAELLSKLVDLTEGYDTIEIGAGTGQIGKRLGIKMTDSYMQAQPEIKFYYAMAGQPVIKYPSSVIKADAITAVKRFKPECVLGCYVTQKYEKGMEYGNALGVDFQRLYDFSSVKRIILVGNKETHGENPLMKLDHQEIDLGRGLITRAEEPSGNRIFVWDK